MYVTRKDRAKEALKGLRDIAEEAVAAVKMEHPEWVPREEIARLFDVVLNYLDRAFNYPSDEPRP